MSLPRRLAYAASAALLAAMLAGCGDDPPVLRFSSPPIDSAVPSGAATTTPAKGTGARCPKPVAPAGWGPLRFADDFTGTTLNTGKWSVYDDPDGKVPRSADRVGVAGGELRIAGYVGTDGKDRSGGLSSNLNLKYGHVDVCFRVDQGAGYSAILLMWPQSEKWPDDGEIDISEVNMGARAYTNSFVHNHPNNDRLGHKTVADFTRWHVMGMDWTPGHVTFSLDGVKQWTAGLDPRTAGLVPTTSAMHLAIQFDQGCDPFVECRDAHTPEKVVMHTDWVRIYAYQP